MSWYRTICTFITALALAPALSLAMFIVLRVSLHFAPDSVMNGKNRIGTGTFFAQLYKVFQPW
jgi:hypothetical protein